MEEFNISKKGVKMLIERLVVAAELPIRTAALIFVAGAVSLMLSGIANLIAG